jgi:apoptosis-inducing factor 3
MLGSDQPFTMAPFFWTKHFDLSIRYVGHAETWDETLVEGDLTHRHGLVRFRRAGRDLAVATVECDNESLRVEAAMESEFRRCSCTDWPAGGHPREPLFASLSEPSRNET